METFLRIVHLTDLHFGDEWNDRSYFPGLEIHSSHVARLLTEAVQRLERASPITNTRIVATGDLTTTGSERAFRIATQFLRKSTRIGKTLTLGFDAPNSLMLPGNHDTWQNNKNMGLKKGTGKRSPYHDVHFDRTFATSAPDADPPLSAPFYFPYRVTLNKENPRVFLYAFDSTRLDLLPEMIGGPDGLDPHLYHFWACGYVDAEQLNRLRELTAQEDPYDGHTVRIAAVHHPLAYPYTDPQEPGFIHTFKKALVNIATVQRELVRLKFSAALCGHQHRDFRKTIFPVTYPVVPIAISSDRYHQNALHILSGGSAIQREEGPGRWARLTSSVKDSGLTNVLIDQFIRSQAQRNRASSAKAHSNEFCVYDFQREASNGPYQIRVLSYFYQSHSGPEAFIPKEESILPIYA